MKFEGGCYCGDIRYQADGDIAFKGACHCRECQHISGGSANLIMALAEDGFTYTKGAPTQFARDDLDQPTIREFCGRCGTPILSRSANAPGAVIIKIGSMDDPALFGGPDVAIHTDDKYDYHVIADGVMQFAKLPQ